MDDEQPEMQSANEVFVTTVLFESALGVLAILLGWGLGPDAREMIPEIHWSAFVPAIDWDAVMPIASGIGYGFLAAFPMLAAIEVLRRIPWEPVRALERLNDDGAVAALLQLRTSEMIVISLCAGIGEELLFRGWLMYWIADGWTMAQSADSSPTVAIVAGLIVSSIAFGLVHPLTKLYIAVAAVMGVYFGVLLMYSGNLLVPIVAHATYDALQLIMTARSGRRENSEKNGRVAAS
ncbi:CAAX amino terminal protease self- immunity [Rubripirellula lacrimiformis]|uniref:CAAX amino terminal protease self-immunity n=1 Tax=Rubripirellula lacrimiformis TaxID=1930273 RepID=A0A517NIG3_9BACT|nr:type II CAAX endopeptidase family protein [Rubripirellula lacrimiformis]QDT06843.1 CAAX amino terminal protease self- immunity [Rubripirellula lacrimiformis]